MSTDTQPASLSSQQITHFETFGYLVIQHPLPQSRETLSQSLECLHSADEETCAVQHIGKQHPAIASISHHSVWGQISQQLIGISQLHGDTGFMYRQELGWHNDHDDMQSTFNQGLRFPLFSEPLSRDDGRFLVIPGSHFPQSHYTRMLIDTLNKSPNDLGMATANVPGHIIECRPDHVIITHHCCEYALCLLANPKHALAIDFVAPTQPAETA